MPKKRAYWCDKCQIPLLGEVCCLCGKKGRDIGTADLRPVFREELAFISEKSGTRVFKKNRDFRLWGLRRDYYYKGHKYIKAKPDSDKSRLILTHYPYTNGKTIARSSGRFLERLEKGNRDYLEKLEFDAVRLINEVIEKYPKRLPTVSFSGGKDSVVTSYLVQKAMSTGKVVHIFGDTTIETPDTYKFIEKFKQDHPLIPFITSKPSADFYELCEKIAPPSRIQRWCCTTHKAASLSRVINVINNSTGVISFSGIRKEESSSRAGYEPIMEGDKIANQILVNPILDWSTLDVWITILVRDLSINHAYKKGFVRMGCYPCPFNSAWWEFLGRHCYADEFKKWNKTLVDYAVAAHKYDPEEFVERGIWKSRVGGLGLNAIQTKIKKEQCMYNKDKYTYTLQTEWNNRFWEYLKPLGKLETVYEDDLISRKILIAQDGEILAIVKATHPYGKLEVVFQKEKHKLQFRRYFERQVKKFQTCVQCGACASHCPQNAISMNPEYYIDEEKCIHCLKCIFEIDRGCIAAHSLNFNEKREEVNK